MSEEEKTTKEDSEEEKTSSTESKQDSDNGQKKVDPVRRITKIVLIVCLVIFVWYLFADRFTPYTDQARIKTLVVPIVPRVSGYLTEVNVRLHSIVSEGQLLFQIDKRPYELAVKKAEADLDNVAQQIGVLTATVKSAAGRVGVSKAQLDRAQRNYDRTQSVLEKNPGALSQADVDRTETSLAQALERLVSAEADLDKAKQELGTTGPDNPQLRAAVVTLEQAQLDLAFTSIHAPSPGVIESFNVDVGHYGQSGQPLATFISTHDVWIQADMRENNIGNVEAGDEVEFALDIAPGSIFDGTVRSIGYGVSSGESNDRGDLPTVSNSQGWLRDPQRFPVIISINNDDFLGLIRSGAQADVIIYTSSNPILNLIGWFQIRIKSWLSYVR
ncbi:HlyD family secretion protein [Bacteroidota bacterium]